MENYSYSSYPDSVNSSPRSREVDCENASWDEPPSSNYKVKFMCSYGGKIHPRPHDNQLSYVGGDTKILSVDRNIRFSSFMSKLSTLYEADVCFKYQLPGEDLDALISVTNDEDLELMMLEYDRLQRASNKPARLRLFLFPFSSPADPGFGSTDSKRQWFVDVLNSVQMQNLESNSQPVQPVETSVGAADFLFGLDKGQQQHQAVGKIKEPALAAQLPQRQTVPEVYGGSEHVMGEPVVTPADIHRQIQELQRLQISSQEQAMYNRKSTDEQSLNPPRVYPGEYYQPNAPIPAQVPVANQAASLWPEHHITTGSYPTNVAPVAASEPPVYLVQTPAGVYQAQTVRPVTGQVSQPYYGMQRVVPEFYREQAVYGTVPPQSSFQQGGGPHKPEVPIAMVRTAPPPPPPDHVYAHVSYDNVGRQVYYTAPAGLNVLPQPLQHPGAAANAAATEVDIRQSGGALFPEGKIVTNKP
nr:PB1 domain containing protein [Ipomoea batatas]